MALIHVYSTFDHPRLRYTLDMLLGHSLGQEYQLHLSEADYKGASGPCLNYSKSRLRSEEVFLPAGSLLRSSGWVDQEPVMEQAEGLPMFYGQKGISADLPFDLPALYFFLLSRYEEYGPYRADKHGRFPASESLAFREGFLGRPLADEWAMVLGQMLERKFAGFKARKTKFEVQCTYDVDHAWAYRYRPLWQQAAGAGKALARGKFGEFGLRLEGWRGKGKDPFQTFEYLDSLHDTFGFSTMYFFLLPDKLRGYDRTLSPDHPRLKRLIRKISDRYPVGIHPSYASNDNPSSLRREIENLRGISGKKVEHSRQHYLRFKINQTYKQFLEEGIVHDHTMGYADAVGFRASTSRPFKWYDLERETGTALTIHPFQVMDGTLKNYLGLQPSRAFEEVKPLIDNTRATGGRFVTLWHNSSFGRPSGWVGWQNVYEQILQYLHS